jgi:hypothetical protein
MCQAAGPGAAVMRSDSTALGVGRNVRGVGGTAPGGGGDALRRPRAQRCAEVGGDAKQACVRSRLQCVQKRRR